MSNANGAKHAVILSGGGANGAYEVGVLKALSAGKSRATTHVPLDPDIFVGTSVGAYNAAFLVSGWSVYGTAVIASLEQTWLDYVSSSRESPDNGLFRIRDDPREFLNPVGFILNPLQPFRHLIEDSAALAWDGLQRVVNLVSEQDRPLLERIVQLFDFTSFVSLDPLRQTLNDTIVFDKIRNSSKQLRIIATNWHMGSVRTYYNHDMTDQLGPSIILGSSAIPGIFPPVPIGSQSFVDGGVLLNSPLTPAAEAGANVLHVISLFPEIEKMPLATMSNTLATVYRQQVIAWAKVLEVDIRRAAFINRALRIVALASEAIQTLSGRSPGIELRQDLHLEEIEQYLQQYLHDRLALTIHRYHPGDDISGGVGLLNFDWDRIKNLIERGFDDAVGHDCERNKCVLS